MVKRVDVRTSLFFLGLTLCVCAVPSLATILTFDMSVIFEGPGVPTNELGSPPWVQVEFDDGGTSGTVTMTISAPGLESNPEKISQMYFNLDPLLDPTQLVFSDLAMSTNILEPDISLGTDLYKADGDGFFDILLAFNTNGPALAFNGGDTIEYTISLSGLTADSFDFVSAADGGPGEFYVAAHLLSLGTAQDSAHVTVPEPTTIALLALGGLWFRKRKA